MPVGTCKYCKRDVMWLTLLSGRLRSFDLKEYRLEELGEADAWVAKKTAAGLRAVPVTGERHPPDAVLGLHICREYIEAKQEEKLALDRPVQESVERAERGEMRDLW